METLRSEKVKIIRNNAIFSDLQKAVKKDYSLKDMYKILFNDPDGQTEIRDSGIPILRWGLSDIRVEKKVVCFYDIGINDEYNDFMIKQESKDNNPTAIPQKEIKFPICFFKEGV